MSERDIETGKDVELSRTTPRQPTTQRATPRQPKHSPRPEQLEAQRSSPKSEFHPSSSSAKSSPREESHPISTKVPLANSSGDAPSSSQSRASENKDQIRNNEGDGTKSTPLQTGLDLGSLQKTPQLSNSPAKSAVQSVAGTEQSQPKPYEPVRTNPLRSLDTRRRRLDRLTDESIPEIHIVGEIKFGVKLTNDLSEGAFCRYKVDIGKTCQALGGELSGQTQVAYARHDVGEPLLMSHPIDIHFGMSGLQGWGSPRISIQSFRLDWLGRRILHGYGFAHIPLNPGRHSIEVSLWRPIGTPDQELRAYLLGETPSLVDQDPLYESAWKDRCRLLTTSSGSIFIEIFVVTRFLKEQGVIQRTVS